MKRCSSTFYILITLAVLFTAEGAWAVNCTYPMSLAPGTTFTSMDGSRRSSVPRGKPWTVRPLNTLLGKRSGTYFCTFRSSNGQIWKVRASDCTFKSSNLTRNIRQVQRITQSTASRRRSTEVFSTRSTRRSSTPTADRSVATSALGEQIAKAGWDTAGTCIEGSDSWKKKTGRKYTCSRWEASYACLRGVRLALQKIGAVTSASLGLHAVNAGPALSRNGFRRLSGCNPRNAPLGAVLIYNGGPSGHIEIKSKSPNGSIYYCSDYCDDQPRNEASRARFFEACYVK